VLATLIAAAEPSKVPFYAAGGVLVIWAVALSAIGLNRPEFPGDAAAQRGVIGVTAVLVVITIACAILTSAFPH
jgi:hypothetical protein